MSNEPPYLSIIIPAYNEAERISKTLFDIDKRLENAAYTYEIIVVNDGSTDNTSYVVRNLEDRVRHLKLIDLRENVGKGGAVRGGMLSAEGQIRLFTDADNSTSIDQFDKMIPLFEKGCDIVIGSRTAKGTQLDPPEPFYRQLIGKSLNLLIQLVLLPGIWDTQCGFKAFTQEASEKIFKLSALSGWGFDFEILSLAKKLRFRIDEIPVYWVDVLGSHMTWMGGLQFLRDILIVRWRLWRGFYN